MKIDLSSDEVNFLVYKYLLENGFYHTSYGFFNEANISNNPIFISHSEKLPTNALVSFLQKAMIYVYIEFHTEVNSGRKIDCEEPFSFFKKHECWKSECFSSEENEEAVHSGVADKGISENGQETQKDNSTSGNGNNGNVVHCSNNNSNNNTSVSIANNENETNKKQDKDKSNHLVYNSFGNVQYNEKVISFKDLKRNYAKIFAQSKNSRRSSKSRNSYMNMNEESKSLGAMKKRKQKEDVSEKIRKDDLPKKKQKESFVQNKEKEDILQNKSNESISNGNEKEVKREDNIPLETKNAKEQEVIEEGINVDEIKKNERKNKMNKDVKRERSEDKEHMNDDDDDDDDEIESEGSFTIEKDKTDTLGVSLDRDGTLLKENSNEYMNNEIKNKKYINDVNSSIQSKNIEDFELSNEKENQKKQMKTRTNDQVECIIVESSTNHSKKTNGTPRNYVKHNSTHNRVCNLSFSKYMQSGKMFENLCDINKECKKRKATHENLSDIQRKKEKKEICGMNNEEEEESVKSQNYEIIHERENVNKNRKHTDGNEELEERSWKHQNKINGKDKTVENIEKQNEEESKEPTDEEEHNKNQMNNFLFQSLVLKSMKKNNNGLLNDNLSEDEKDNTENDNISWKEKSENNKKRIINNDIIKDYEEVDYDDQDDDDEDEDEEEEEEEDDEDQDDIDNENEEEEEEESEEDDNEEEDEDVEEENENNDHRIYQALRENIERNRYDPTNPYENNEEKK